MSGDNGMLGNRSVPTVRSCIYEETLREPKYQYSTIRLQCSGVPAQDSRTYLRPQGMMVPSRYGRWCLRAVDNLLGSGCPRKDNTQSWIQVFHTQAEVDRITILSILLQYIQGEATRKQ